MLLLAMGISQGNAGFTNGGFESDLVGWTSRGWVWDSQYNCNDGSAGAALCSSGRRIKNFPPTTADDLGLLSNALVYTGTVGSGTDVNTGNALGFPLFGNRAARINFGTPTGYAVSSIDQTATVTIDDVDPTDGKVHVRFAIAPVLQNPGHPENQQPYFFVEVTNVTKGTQLFYTFNFSGQSGVPWITVGSWQYTNWQAIDIAPGPGQLDVGDEVRVVVYAARCGQGGHGGYVYMDSGPALTTLPGPYIYASAPQFTEAGSLITYTYVYGNSGDSPLTNTTVQVNPPQDNTTPIVSRQSLTFQSISGAGTGSCTVPAVNAAGTITCNFGTLNPNNVGTFQVTYLVPNPTVGPINHGDYLVRGDSSPAILGPLVQTFIGSQPLVDLAVTIDDGNTSVTWGDVLTYTIEVSNGGPEQIPAGATISQTLPATLTGATWTCTAAGGATCPSANGTGSINETTTEEMPLGATLTYTLVATATGTGTGTINVPVTVTPPAGVQDTNSGNNTTADVNNVSSGLATLQVFKSGAGDGVVTTVPSGINCGASCGPTAFPAGSQVLVYASASPGSIFAGWSGDCTGTATSCAVTLGPNGTLSEVTATFVPPLTVTPVVGANGTVNPAVTQPVAPGGTTSFTVTPSPGFAPVITDNCGPGGDPAGGSFVGNTYTTNAVSQSCNINFSFTNDPADVRTVTPTVGPNGSISPNTPRTVLTGGEVSYVVVPNSGFYPEVGGTCPAGLWSENVYRISPVNDSCSVNFTFATLSVLNDVAPSGTRTLTPASNDTSGGSATLDIATLDLDPTTPGIQTVRSTAQGTWRITNLGTGTVSFEPAPGFYGNATLQYGISNTAGFSATATMTVPIDPSGVVYDSTTRLPLAGANVTLSYTGPDGVVDDFLVSPASVTTDADGRYAFWLAGSPTGVFNLTVSLAGYTFVSTAIPPEAGEWPIGGGPITAVVGAPQVGDPTTYYLSGPMPAFDVTNNHIPLDLGPVLADPTPIPTLSFYMTVLLALLLVVFSRRHLGASRLGMK